MRENDDALDLRGYVAMLRRRWWILLLAPLVLGGATYWFASQRAPSYSATAVLLVTQASSLGITTSNDIQAASLLTQTYAQLASSPEVLELASTSLAVPRPVSDLFGHVEARANPLTQLISIEATYEDPQLAADVANATANAFVAWLAERESQLTGENSQALQEDIDQARTRVEETSSELTKLRGLPGARTSEENGRIASLETLLSQYEATYANLLDIQNRLSLARLAAQGQVSLVTAARAPANPSGYPAALYAAIAALFGVGVAGLGIVLIESMDRRVREPRDVLQAVDLPVLASIPRSRSLKSENGVSLVDSRQPHVAEAFRMLRTRSQFAVNGRGIGTIAVLSSGRKERHSAVAANLAVAYAEQGWRTVLLDGAFSGRHRRADGCQPLGLSDLLARRAVQLQDILVPGPHPNLLVLPPGRQSPDQVMNRLTHERASEILNRIKSKADVVIVNPSARGSGSDTLLFAGAADNAIIVAEAGVTRVESLQATLDEIAVTGINVLGVVLNGVHSGRSRR